MERLVIFFGLLLLGFQSGNSQNWNRLYILSHEAEIHMANMKYENAANTYIRMLRELPGSSNLRFRLGYCYLNAHGKIELAISNLEEASSNISIDTDPASLRDESAPVESILLLGTAYQRNLQFDEARNAYIWFIDILPEGDHRIRLAEQYIQSIENARISMDNPMNVEKDILGREINTSASNVNAILSGDGLTMAYTSISRRGFEVFVVKKENDSWGRPKNINRQLGRDYLMTSGISFDGMELYLVYYLPDRSDIYHTVFKNGYWRKAKKLKRPVNGRSNETHASVSADGQTLYFTSNRDGGYGGLDIYRARLSRRGRWKDVTNMGKEINTPFNEETPFITGDGNYLFFSSEGHNSMGGYDVFYVDMANPSEVHNLGYPLNNTNDNLFYFPVDDGRTGYISFYDKGGFGQKDIYLVSLSTDHLLHDEKMTDPDLPLTADAGQPVQTGITDGSAEPEPANTDESSEIRPARTGAFESGSESKLQSYIIEGSAGQLPGIDFFDGLESETEQAATGFDIDNLSYSVQFIALEREINPAIMDRLAWKGVYVQHGNDGLSRFISGFYETQEAAMKELPSYIEKGFADAFIRINNYIPNFTIQLAATRNFIKFEFFNSLSQVICTKGEDKIYRYSWGQFSSIEDAGAYLEQIRAMGYSDAFIRKM